MLDAETFPLFAYRHYDNPQCVTIEEFYSDLKRFKYLKKLVNRYLDNGEFLDRLVLNHLTVLHNLFGIEAAAVMLNYKMDERHWPVLKPCLEFLGFAGQGAYSDVVSDEYVLERLAAI